jgi:hypothetical protein
MVEPTINYSEDEKKVIINKIASIVEAQYVYPEIGEKISQTLQSEYSKNSYVESSTPKEFADELIKTINTVVVDKHNRVLAREESTKHYFDMLDNLTATFGEDVFKFDRQTKGSQKPIKKKVMTGKLDRGIEKVKILDHNIGYIKMTMINSRASLDEEKMLEALERFSSTTALIFDLRECRGGHGDMVHHTQNFLFGYEEGDSPIQILEIYFRPQDDVIKRMAEPWTYGNSYKGKPVYVLVSSKTGSGAEDFAFSLKITKRATLIGETTAGAGHPTSFHPITDDILFMCSIGRAYDPKTNKGWETTGVTPHIEVNPDLALDKAIELISK